MTTKDFNKKFKEICTTYGCKFEPQCKDQIRYTVDTPFGKMQIISSASPRIKLYTIFYKFTEDFAIDYFYRYFSDNEVINPYSKKWNVHTSDIDWAFDTLDERLNNLKYILKRDGKVCGTEYKPFLEEIETK